MKDKNKIFLDLSKLTEEQIKGLVPIIEGAGDKVYPYQKDMLLKGQYYADHYFIFTDGEWFQSECKRDKTEITYTEFLELFGKTEQLEENKAEAKKTKYYEQFRENTFYISDDGVTVMYHFSKGYGIGINKNKENTNIFCGWMSHPDNGEWKEFLISDCIEEIEYKKEFEQTLMKNLAYKYGYFVFPKAEEGDFPDLSGFEGVPMLCGYGKIEASWDKENVVCKLLDGFSSIQDGAVYLPDLVKPLPTNQTLTYQELVEKIGLERACELAGVDLRKIEIKN